MMFFGIFWLLVLFVLIRAVMPPASGGRLPPGRAREMDAELARLREEMDRMNGQIERLLEEQGFLLKLLEKGGPAAELPPADGPEAHRSREG